MMDPRLYLQVAGISALPHQGGQELILNEVVTLLRPYRNIWVPFADTCVSLIRKLRYHGHHVISHPHDLALPIDNGALYFGTPTIVGNKPLFPAGAMDRGIKTKEQERAEVVRLCTIGGMGIQHIVCGLGSGDISVDERLKDVGPGAEVVVMKKFGVGSSKFTDWVITKEVT